MINQKSEMQTKVLEGNSNLIEEYFKNSSEDIKVAFFGDHYMSDVHYSSAVSWDAIAIIEEMAQFDSSLETTPAD